MLCSNSKDLVAAPGAGTASSSSEAPCPGSERLMHVGPFRFDEEPVGYRIDARLMRRCLESCFAQVGPPISSHLKVQRFRLSTGLSSRINIAFR